MRQRSLKIIKKLAESDHWPRLILLLLTHWGWEAHWPMSPTKTPLHLALVKLSLMHLGCRENQSKVNETGHSRRASQNCLRPSPGRAKHLRVRSFQKPFLAKPPFVALSLCHRGWRPGFEGILAKSWGAMKRHDTKPCAGMSSGRNSAWSPAAARSSCLAKDAKRDSWVEYSWVDKYGGHAGPSFASRYASHHIWPRHTRLWRVAAHNWMRCWPKPSTGRSEGQIESPGSGCKGWLDATREQQL